MIKISVVMPVYNVEEYLEQCIDSILNQTLKEIELICINDASTDDSLNILEKYAMQDERVRIINYTQNCSASQARKDGVNMAKGEYIMFMDADDYWNLETCAELYKEIQDRQVDILHFNAKVENCNNLPQGRIDSNQKHIAPYIGTLKGRDVFEGCFINKKYSFTLWNKIFNASVCKEAFKYIKDGIYPKAQDLYAYFMIAYFAKSYCGIDSPMYYHYCFGRGITGHSTFDCKMLERFCTQSYVAREIKLFLEQQQANENYKQIAQDLEQRLMIECINSWKDRMPNVIASEGFDILMKYWNNEKVVLHLAQSNWKNRIGLLDKIQDIKSLNECNKEVKTIATYYFHVANGGVQRVISHLIPIWKQLGYKVILFTDTETSENDYEIPEDVERIVLPHFQDVTEKDFYKRAKIWWEAIEKYKIDTVVYHAWLSDLLLWDMLCIKVKKTSFVVNTHSVFSMPLINMPFKFKELCKLYSLTDAVVSLSRVDTSYWGKFVKRAFYIPNPLPYNLEDMKVSKLNEKNIVWIGRVSNEKHPLDAIRIMAKVVKSIPEAKLFFVGSSTNSIEMKKCRKEAEKLGIEDNIIFCGFHKDVHPFYEMASINMMTSEYEGFGLVLGESKIHGIPTVMYELPYLELVRDGKGIFSVAQKDIEGMAYQICSLLKDDQLLYKMGKEARQSIEPFINYDVSQQWKQVFESQSRDVEDITSLKMTSERIMLETLINHSHCGTIKRLNQKSSTVRTSNMDERAELNAIKQGWSFRIGRMITFIPRKIRGGIWCYQEHGMEYTIGRIKVKFSRLIKK